MQSPNIRTDARGSFGPERQANLQQYMDPREPWQATEGDSYWRGKIRTPPTRNAGLGFLNLAGAREPASGGWEREHARPRGRL